MIILLISILIPIMISSNTTAQITDTDGDGLSDSDEIKYHTDQNDADSDDDGLLDGEEIDWNKNTDGKGDINALDHDSDDDGIFDGTEMGITKDMLHEDTDLNKNHFREDADPPSKHPGEDSSKYTTSMIKWDTDGDQLSDGVEDKNRNGRYDKDLNETDPNFPDRDGDGIEDSEDIDIDNDGMYNVFEEEFELDPYNPDDAKLDPDADGFNNLREYLGDDNNPGNNDWSNPKDPNSVPDLPPVVIFSKDGIQQEANLTITFDIMTFNVTDSKDDYTAGLWYTWTFGDGYKETDRVYDPKVYKKRHIFEEPGNFLLKLEVKDQHNNVGEDTLNVIITVPIGITDTTITVEQTREEFNDKNTIRRNGYVAYRIEDVRTNEKITIDYNVLDPDEDAGIRIFVIPADNYKVYKENKPGEEQISRKYSEYWRGHLTSLARNGKIEFEAQEEDDIIVIFDNGFYDEYKKTVGDFDEPVDYKVKTTREESPLFLILMVVVLVLVLISVIVGAYFYTKLRRDRGMTKYTREAAIETQKSLDREMAQLEYEIQESFRRSPAGGPMTAMPMQQQPRAPPQQPPQMPQQRPAAPMGGPAQVQAPGTVPRTPMTAGGQPTPGGAKQVPGATPLPPGTAVPGAAASAGRPPGQAPKQQMLPAAKPQTQTQQQ